MSCTLLLQLLAFTPSCLHPTEAEISSPPRTSLSVADVIHLAHTEELLFRVSSVPTRDFSGALIVGMAGEASTAYKRASVPNRRFWILSAA